MGKMITMALAAVLVSMIVSTREGRQEARARLRPYTRAMAAPVGLLWLWIIMVAVM